MGNFEEETIIEKEEREERERKTRKKKPKEEQDTSKQEEPKKKKKRQKTVTIYAVVPYDSDFTKWLDSYTNGEYNSFEYKPLTFCGSNEEAEEYCEQYFYLMNYCHFKLWCDCHDGEDVNTSESWTHYVERVLLPDDDPNTQFLRICSFQFPVSQVASLLRMSLNSLPVGLDNESPEIIPEIMIEAITTKTPLPHNYLQVFKGMKEFYKDYEQSHNKTDKDFLVSEVIEEAVNMYHQKMEEIEDEEYSEAGVS